MNSFKIEDFTKDLLKLYLNPIVDELYDTIVARLIAEGVQVPYTIIFNHIGTR